MQQHFDAVVIGAGIHGLCSAWALKRAGLSRVAVFERGSLQHDQGSSHGTSRITRSTYVDAAYVRLMQTAHHTAWPALSEDLNETLITPRAMCLFGPKHGPVERYHQAVMSAGAPVSRLDGDAARRRFPDFHFNDDTIVLDDPTAGVIAAERTISGLIAWLKDAGVKFFVGTEIAALKDLQSAIQLTSLNERYEADHCVVTAGAWTARLLPVAKPRLTPIRQTVGYFELLGTQGEQRARDLPVWVYVGPEQNDVFYGLPAFGRPGIKIGQHITAGRASDPDGNREVAPEHIENIRVFAERVFGGSVGECVGSETCLYTNTATEDIIWDLHPESDRIAIGAGFSGHGFKFGPLSGQILADLALHGTSDLPAFRNERDRFRLTSNPTA